MHHKMAPNVSKSEPEQLLVRKHVLLAGLGCFDAMLVLETLKGERSGHKKVKIGPKMTASKNDQTDLRMGWKHLFGQGQGYLR